MSEKNLNAATESAVPLQLLHYNYGSILLSFRDMTTNRATDEPTTASQLNTDWIHPWIGLDWIGLGRMTANCLENETFRWGLKAELVKINCTLAFSVCV